MFHCAAFLSHGSTCCSDSVRRIRKEHCVDDDLAFTTKLEGLLLAIAQESSVIRNANRKKKKNTVSSKIYYGPLIKRGS